ncbi:hypothetical protein [Streptomyces sp. NPDC051219]|uniref:hypothetical protein n=1 Tax=Streptomyces sp. NPDC051219 TaxID=3155283 RepID=UPI003430E696
MDALQQHMIDTYRAAQHGAPTPPLPGTHDWETLRFIRDERAFRAVIAGRPARGRVRAALARAFGPHPARPTR